jgi:anti-sigma factor RsiW
LQCPIQSRENAEILLAYCSRSLDTETATLLKRHMEECPACRETFAAQEAVWVALDAWEAEKISMDFNRRLYRRVEEQERQGWWRLILWPVMPFSMRPVLPLAAACVLVVAGLLFRAPEGPDLNPHRSPETVDIEQVERTLEDMEMLRLLHPNLQVDQTVPRSL